MHLMTTEQAQNFKKYGDKYLWDKEKFIRYVRKNVNHRFKESMNSGILKLRYSDY